MNKLQFKVLVISGCLFAISGRVAAQMAPGSEANGRLNSDGVSQAQALLSAGKVDAAIDILKALPESGRHEPQVNSLLGLAYYQKGDLVHAVDSLALAVRQTEPTDPRYRQAVQFLALSHYRLGHVNEAIPYLEQVGAWAPHDVETANALGISYIQTHNPDKAREAFARMFGVARESASAHLINARMMVRQQFEEFAETELGKALELDPRLPEANFLLGELAIYHANIDLGIQYLQKEIAINPAFANAYYRLGEAYTRQLKWDEAVAPLLKAIWLNSDFSAPYIVLGKVYMKKGEIGAAEGILRRALKMDPNNIASHYLLAQALQQSNRPDEARKEFQLADRLRASSEK